MDDKLHELELMINDHHNEIGSLKHRMDNVEQVTNEIRQLNTATQLIAQRQNTIDEKIDGLSETVKEMDNRPKDNWNKATWLIIAAVLSAAVGSIVNAISSIIK